MVSTFILSQILGGIAFCFDLASFQFKKREHILLLLSISSILIAAHFLLLSQTTAALFVIISIARFITAYKTTSKYALWIFLIANTVVIIATYVEPINILAFIATTFVTVSNFQKDDKSLRLIMMVGTSLWIMHNAIVFTPALILVEAFFLSSNLLGYYRHYIRDSK